MPDTLKMRKQETTCRYPDQRRRRRKKRSSKQFGAGVHLWPTEKPQWSWGKVWGRGGGAERNCYGLSAAPVSQQVCQGVKEWSWACERVRGFPVFTSKYKVFHPAFSSFPEDREWEGGWVGSWLLARFVLPHVHTVGPSALKNFPENGDKKVDKREMFNFGNNLESEAEKCCIFCSYTRQMLRESHPALWCLRVASHALITFVPI